MIIIKEYGGVKLEELQLLGQGTQGKVYRIDSQRCIKVFKSKKVCKAELKTLIMSQNNIHFPKLYEAGENYIIRECVNGTELDRYLSNHPLTADISNEIIELYESMIEVGYTRLDSAIFHIFITTSGSIKLIDTAKSLKKKTIYPRLILAGLKELGYMEDFLSFVKYTRPQLYIKWIKYIK